MKKKSKREILIDVGCEILGCLLISFATYNVAAQSEFAVSGFSGVALILYRLFGLHMGLMIFLMNVPFALICAKFLGVRFLIRSVRCILIQSVLMDFVVPHFPLLELERVIAALTVGVLYGIGYAVIYMRGSSTGGVDFIVMLWKHARPHVKTGVLSFAAEFVTLVAAGIIFRDVEAVIYGVVIVFLSTTTIDRIILGMNSGAVALIVTKAGNGQNVCRKIDALCERGSTILPGRGGYTDEEKEVVLVTGSYKEIYRIQRLLKEEEPDAFTIVLDSKEVQGEGFRITRVAGEN